MTAAETRIANDQVRAKRSLVGNNLAAVNSMPTSHVAHNPRPVGHQNNVDRLLPPSAPMPRPQPQAVQRPTGGPPPGFEPMYASAPQQSQQPELPPVVQQAVHAIGVDQLVNSPDMVAAFTKVKLRDHFLNRYSGADTGRQVLEILNAGNR